MKTVDQIHGLIVEIILKNAPNNWTHAIFDIELLHNFSSCKGDYIFGDEKINIDVFLFPIEITDYFRDLYKLTIDKEGDWNRAQYMVFPNGEFKATFTWDDTLIEE